jgi:hypothetical protein
MTSTVADVGSYAPVLTLVAERAISPSTSGSRVVLPGASLVRL